nr:hypothetical protein [Tanacetum cinerariifolium]
MRDPEREVGYGITESWDEIVETLQQDTDEIYMRLDDEQTERQLLAGRLNMLSRDRRAHAYTRHLMETEARMSREAWVRATDASDLVHGEVMSLRTTVLGDSPTGTGDSFVGTGYHITGTAGTCCGPTQLELPEEAGGSICHVMVRIFRNLTGIVFSYDYKEMAPRRTSRSTADQETINATSVTNAQLQAMIDQGDTVALAARDALRSTNGDDSHNSRTGVRRTERANRECTYTDFLKCQPLPFKGTEGVASLSQWCERMESVKGTDLASYTQRFQELALLCERMYSEESNKIEKHVGGLLDMIHGSVVASKPKTMQEAIEIATELMDKKIRTFAERETASKRKECPKLKNNNNHGNQGGRNNALARVYAIGHAGTDPDANVMT